MTRTSMGEQKMNTPSPKVRALLERVAAREDIDFVAEVGALTTEELEELSLELLASKVTRNQAYE
jgi:hypothetical protein